MPQDKYTQLKRVFGHSTFRPGQEQIIDALLAGRDVLGVMPTGAGKSVCYQIPALLLPGVTLVISPLISLMADQVAALTQAGVPAGYINSTLTAPQYAEVFRRAVAGELRILYVAPERLATEGFLRLAAQITIPFVAVDEAHCVSQWGQDFRPGYLQIAGFLAGLPQRPVVGAFTATATQTVKDDIIRLLQLQNPLQLTTGFDRPNLYFGVEEPQDKGRFVRNYVKKHKGESGIIYCATRKAVELLCAGLCHEGVAATRYHAGLTDEERRENQQAFVFDERPVMVATNAFGMGIDKSNVRYVLHYNMPKDMESYYQEAGRAGRDGEPAECILLYSGADVQTARYFINQTDENEALSEEERAAVKQRDGQRLSAMVHYCKTTDCLRSTMLHYFGEAHSGACRNCGNCRGEFVEEDITVDAQKILSGVIRADRRYSHGIGAVLLAAMLYGSKEQRKQQPPTATKGVEKGYRYQPLDVSGKALLDVLKAVRMQLARQAKAPAYVVFSDAALADMARRRPKDMAEFMLVSGVGEMKAARYGAAFLQAIHDHEVQNGVG